MSPSSKFVPNISVNRDVCKLASPLADARYFNR